MYYLTMLAGLLTSLVIKHVILKALNKHTYTHNIENTCHTKNIGIRQKQHFVILIREIKRQICIHKYNLPE